MGIRIQKHLLASGDAGHLVTMGAEKIPASIILYFSSTLGILAGLEVALTNISCHNKACSLADSSNLL